MTRKYQSHSSLNYRSRSPFRDGRDSAIPRVNLLDSLVSSSGVEKLSLVMEEDGVQREA